MTVLARKTRFGCLSAMSVGLAILLAGCETEVLENGGSDNGGGHSPNVPGGIGPEQVCGNFAGQRPSIDLDSRGQPHIIADEGGSSRLLIFHRIGGAWSSSVFAEGQPGGRYDASRLYMPHMEINSGDQAWISCKFGSKEWGTMLGQGLWCLDNVDSSPSERFFKYLSQVETAKGNGNVSLDPNEPANGVVLASGGNWAKVDQSGSIIGQGNMNSGDSGEKIRFLISPRSGQPGVWHSAMGGYGAQSSAYQNSLRHAQSEGPATWAAYGSYPEQGSDLYHPGIGIDRADPQTCYIGAYYGPGLVINVWNGSQMVFNPSSLPVIDAAPMANDRFGPQWAPASGGGAYVCWARDGRVKLAYVSRGGTTSDPFPGQADPQDVCAGTSPAICTDSSGNIHIAYLNGVICYRTIGR